jgi:hypothetical protein
MSYATFLDALFALDLTDSLRRRRETLEEETLEEESIPGSLDVGDRVKTASAA